MPPRRGRPKKIYNVAKEDPQFARIATLSIRERKQYYGQLARDRAEGLEPRPLDAAAANRDEVMNDAADESEPAGPTYYWLGAISIDEDPARPSFTKVTVHIGHYPEEPDALFPVKVHAYRVNGVLIGDCSLGEMYQGDVVKEVDRRDPFMVIRVDEDGHPNDYPGWARNPSPPRNSDHLKAPRSFSQYDCIPFIPRRSAQMYNPLAFQEEIQTKGLPSETLKILVHCIDEAGGTLHFEEVVKPVPEVTIELITEMIQNQRNVEEDGLEAQIWVLPQKNGIKEVYRWTEGGIAQFLSGKQNELYVQAVLAPKPVKKRKTGNAKGKGKKR